MTTRAAVPIPTWEAGSEVFSAESSGFDVLFRAESAANGETFVWWETTDDSGLLTSGTTEGLPVGRTALA